MFADFEKYIKAETGISDADVKLFRDTAVERTLRRKEFLLHKGDICRHKTFVCKGFLRTYRVAENGNEYIMQFSPENSWVIEPESYDSHTPAIHNIEALEPSEVIMWAKKDFDHLFETVPALKAYSDKLIATKFSLTRQRVFSALSATAEEKYDEFLKTYPGIINRAPLHMVASYLGVSRETLSRIRHAQVKQQV